MGHQRHRKADDRASKNKTIEPESSLYVHDKNICDCRIEEIPVTIDQDRLITQVLHFDSRNKLVFFAVVYTKLDSSGRGTELYSVDTGHGHFHEHTTGHRKRNDRKNIAPLYTQVDVQECFDEGYDLVFEKHLAMTGK